MKKSEMAESLQTCFRRIESDKVTIASLKEQVEVLVAAAEFDRQQRLAALPTLLASEAKAALAEERAMKAEARVAYLEDRLSPPRTFPELRQTRGNRALINAYHESKERP